MIRRTEAELVTLPWTAFIPGEPIAKGRPKACVVQGRARMYTPARTAQWEAFACSLLREEWGGRPAITEAVEVHAVARFKRPQRLTWKRRPMPRSAHVGRPDADNFKTVCDSLEKAGVLANDSLVSTFCIRKVYAAGDEQPGVELLICEAVEVGMPELVEMATGQGRLF